jgi:DNA-binding YbaB/EbfC family protein
MPKGTGGWGGPRSGGTGAGGGGGLDARRAQDMQAKLMEGLAKAQADLATATVEATAGGGAITVTMTGDQRVQSITLAPEIVDPEDVEMLQDLLVVAMNDALEKVQGLQQELMGSVTGGMKLPGLF